MSLSPNSFQNALARVDISYQLTDQNEPVRLCDVVLRPGTPFNNGVIVLNTQIVPHTQGSLISIDIKSTKSLVLSHFEAKYSVDLTDQRMLANGFQSWSQAREMQQTDRIPSIRSGIAWYTQYNLQGDYDFFPHSGEKGHVHSSSYTHFRDVHNRLRFFGSVSEQFGYTYFKSDYNTNTFSIYKDIAGKEMAANQSLELIKVLAMESDSEGALWDTYATFYPDKRCIKNDDERHVNGWTSWYNYYADVSEEIILENINALSHHKYPINVFQIDDGFQTAIGDWLSINNKFPSGMKSVATRIKQANFMAGLWLAPFAVGFSSQLAKEHPEWLIQDPITNKAVVAGPNWGGFYALDMYNKDARLYLKKVFDVVLQDWGFDMLKLDFLFAAAMIPRLGKSRGEIMWDAMEFIRELAGPSKIILGCGAPLAAAWRKLDYCRIGSDVSPWWEGK
ncbi:glycoside hydrolase superfamily [Spinellus fusiger]|nr:glycoside hydrolase superfamily [Spinellus fusiger]